MQAAAFAGGDGDALAKLQRQLKALYEQFDKLAKEPGDPEEKEKRAKLLQQRIKLVMQQIADVQRSRSERQAQKAGDRAQEHAQGAVPAQAGVQSEAQRSETQRDTEHGAERDPENKARINPKKGASGTFLDLYV